MPSRIESSSDLNLVQLDLAVGQLGAHTLDVRHQRRDVFAALLGLTDGFGTRITLSLQCFGAGLDGLALSSSASMRATSKAKPRDARRSATS